MNTLEIAPRYSKTITVEAPLALDEFGFFTTEEIEVEELRLVIVGGTTPSVTWTVRFASDRSATGTEIETAGRTSTNTTTGDQVTGGDIDVSTIPADSHVWLELTTVTTGADQPESVEMTITGRAK